MPQYQKEGYEKAKKLLNLLKVLSEKKNCTMAQLSIAWMLKKRILLCLSRKQKIRTFRRKILEQGKLKLQLMKSKKLMLY